MSACVALRACYMTASDNDDDNDDFVALWLVVCACVNRVIPIHAPVLLLLQLVNKENPCDLAVALALGRGFGLHLGGMVGRDLVGAAQDGNLAFQFFHRLLHGQQKILFAIARHFGVPTVAFAAGKRRKDENATFNVSARNEITRRPQTKPTKHGITRTHRNSSNSSGVSFCVIPAASMYVPVFQLTWL